GHGGAVFRQAVRGDLTWGRKDDVRRPDPDLWVPELEVTHPVAVRRRIRPDTPFKALVDVAEQVDLFPDDAHVVIEVRTVTADARDELVVHDSDVSTGLTLGVVE